MPTDIESQILSRLGEQKISLDHLTQNVGELTVKVAVIETRLERQPEPMGHGPDAPPAPGIVTLNGKHLYVGGPVLLAIGGVILTAICKILGIEINLNQ